MNTQRAKIFIIYLIFGDKHLHSGLEVLWNKVGDLFPNEHPTTVVVDNGPSFESHSDVKEKYVRIPGDNSAREFSGLDEGFRWMQKQQELSSDDIFIIANDTFHRSYGNDYLRFFTSKKVKRALMKGSLIGYVDRYPTKAAFDGKSFDGWIRTSFFISTYSSLSRLLPFSMKNRESEIFSGFVEPFFNPNGPLDTSYQRKLANWLYDDGYQPAIGEWHSKARLTAETLTAMQGKALAIIGEHQLSQKARQIGIPIVDIRPFRRMRSIKRLFRHLRLLQHAVYRVHKLIQIRKM